MSGDCAAWAPEHDGRWCTEPSEHKGPHVSATVGEPTLVWDRRPPTFVDSPPEVAEHIKEDR